jgi:hypothetical protein
LVLPAGIEPAAPPDQRDAYCMRKTMDRAIIDTILETIEWFGFSFFLLGVSTMVFLPAVFMTRVM